MAQKRLTVNKFKQLLDDHPRFRLNEGVFVCGRRRGQACGGCALTLAYLDANPNKAVTFATPVFDWAEEVYGDEYASNFISGFDGNCDEDDGYPCVAISDGAKCRRYAFKVGRLK